MGYIHKFNGLYIYSYIHMSICIELSELIIYCKYACKLSVFEVIYYIFLYYAFPANPFLLNI